MNPPRDFSTLLSHAEHSGVYHLPSSGRSALTSAATTLGFALFEIDLADASELDAPLSELGTALGFPDWYGHNLDALHDCLTDFSWREAPGYILIIRGADRLHADTEAFATLNTVFSDAADFWREAGIPFWIFYDIRADGLATLPTVA